MNDNLLKTYTKDFEDISCTLAEIKSLKRQEMRLRRKLKTLELKYSFLRELVGIDNEGETISLAVKKLFRKNRREAFSVSSENMLPTTFCGLKMWRKCNSKPSQI